MINQKKIKQKQKTRQCRDALFVLTWNFTPLISVYMIYSSSKFFKSNEILWSQYCVFFLSLYIPN